MRSASIGFQDADEGLRHAGFAQDSLLEGDGFEPSVPRKKRNNFFGLPPFDLRQFAFRDSPLEGTRFEPSVPPSEPRLVASATLRFPFARTTGDGPLAQFAGGLHHRSRNGGWPVERVVHLLKGAALGFGAECPEADDAEDIPGGEIEEGGAEHDEIGRRRLDGVAGSHDQGQARRPQDLADPLDAETGGGKEHRENPPTHGVVQIVDQSRLRRSEQVAVGEGRP
jgi:hypothetical protein